MAAAGSSCGGASRNERVANDHIGEGCLKACIGSKDFDNRSALLGYVFLGKGGGVGMDRRLRDAIELG